MALRFARIAASAPQAARGGGYDRDAARALRASGRPSVARCTAAFPLARAFDKYGGVKSASLYSPPALIAAACVRDLSPGQIEGARRSRAVASAKRGTATGDAALRSGEVADKQILFGDLTSHDVLRRRLRLRAAALRRRRKRPSRRCLRLRAPLLPLDFFAVTDHAEGLTRSMAEHQDDGSANATCAPAIRRTRSRRLRRRV